MDIICNTDHILNFIIRSSRLQPYFTSKHIKMVGDPFELMVCAKDDSPAILRRLLENKRSLGGYFTGQKLHDFITCVSEIGINTMEHSGVDKSYFAVIILKDSYQHMIYAVLIDRNPTEVCEVQPDKIISMPDPWSDRHRGWPLLKALADFSIGWHDPTPDANIVIIGMRYNGKKRNNNSE